MITKTVYFIRRGNKLLGTNNRVLPVITQAGNDLLWYMKEYSYKRKPKGENVESCVITYPESWD